MFLHGHRILTIVCGHCNVVCERRQNAGGNEPLYCSRACARAAKRRRQTSGTPGVQYDPVPATLCPGCGKVERLKSRAGFRCCDRCRARLHGSCMRKSIYLDSVQARSFAATHMLDLDPYRCRFCTHWHLTSPDTGGEMAGDVEMGERLRAAGFARAVQSSQHQPPTTTTEVTMTTREEILRDNRIWQCPLWCNASDEETSEGEHFSDWETVYTGAENDVWVQARLRREWWTSGHEADCTGRVEFAIGGTGADPCHTSLGEFANLWMVTDDLQAFAQAVERLIEMAEEAATSTVDDEGTSAEWRWTYDGAQQEAEEHDALADGILLNGEITDEETVDAS